MLSDFWKNNNLKLDDMETTLHYQNLFQDLGISLRTWELVQNLGISSGLGFQYRTLASVYDWV